MPARPAPIAAHRARTRRQFEERSGVRRARAALKEALAAAQEAREGLTEAPPTGDLEISPNKVS
jgi:hypothetical protein